MNFSKNASPVFLFITLFAFTSCVTKKKFKQTEDFYETKTRSLDMELSRAKRDSIEMQKKIDELTYYKDSLDRKTENSRAIERSTTKVTKAVLSPEDEYQKKALMIYGFTKNIEWDATYSGSGYFVIGVFGSSLIYEKLKTELEGKKAGNQFIVIKQFTTTNNLTNCHVIFVTNASYSKIGSIKEKINKYPTLLVTEEDYLKNDAHINMVVDGKTIKYNVNKTAMSKAQLKPSSKLITLADK